MRRIDIRKILADPKKRRRLMALTLQALQAREGRDLTLEQAYAVVDRVYSERSRPWHRNFAR